MKTAMISTGNEVANNSEICPALILEMATFRLEVRKSIGVIFFSLSSSQTPLLLHTDLCRSLGPK